MCVCVCVDAFERERERVCTHVWSIADGESMCVCVRVCVDAYVRACVTLHTRSVPLCTRCTRGMAREAWHAGCQVEEEEKEEEEGEEEGEVNEETEEEEAVVVEKGEEEEEGHIEISPSGGRGRGGPSRRDRQTHRQSAESVCISHRRRRAGAGT